MLQKIKSIKGGVTLTLANPFSRQIYNIDSINLIIGNNGSGKTTLIKSIIRDLAVDDSPLEFIGEGVSDRMGIIYYTAAPFHKTIKSSSNGSVGFLDASAKILHVGSFMHAAQEYIDIAQSLEISDDLRSKQNFDLREAAFTLAYSLYGSISQQTPINAGPRIAEQIKSLKAYNVSYARLKRHLQDDDSVKKVESYYQDEDEIKLFNHTVEWLNEELEDVARRIDRARSEIADYFLAQCGADDFERTVDWIATICVLRENPAPTGRRELAVRLLVGKSMGSISATGKRFTRTRETVAEFLSLLERTGSGKVLDLGDNVEIQVDTPTLLRTRPKKALIEDAHKKGLIRIGFDNISSGQAAILHQMINISGAARQLVSRGKKRLLVFIDEGDLLLHLQWQREYISLVDSRLNSLQKTLNLHSVQLVVASHSAILATDILRDSITRLGFGGDVPSFAAPLQQIVNFSFGTPSIGIIAQRTIESLREKVSLDDSDIALVGQIDDAFIRDVLMKRVSK